MGESHTVSDSSDGTTKEMVLTTTRLGLAPNGAPVAVAELVLVYYAGVLVLIVITIFNHDRRRRSYGLTYCDIFLLCC